MLRRKIQLVAGTTFTISLPKDWVKRNKLSGQDELTLKEKDDRSLVIVPGTVADKSVTDISINIDEYLNDIDQVLFSVYYMGVENIRLSSKDSLTPRVKSRIRKTLTHMSGTEITYENTREMNIKVLLDKTKVDVIQVLYRISLIIESTIGNILGPMNIDEIKINENEIDRLYHLTAKLISLSLRDSKILMTSGIRSTSLVPSLFLISKRLENIADNLNRLSQYTIEYKKECSFPDLLKWVETEITRSMKYLLKNDRSAFEKVSAGMIADRKKHADTIDDKFMEKIMRDILRFVVNIEEEIVTISFYRKMIDEGKL